MKNIINAVEKHRALILAAERYVWANPETGYKEVKTSAYLAEQFEKLGYKLTFAEGITGFTAEVDTGREGPTLLIMGEMDSIICPSHPECDPKTGAVHSCGHNTQCASLLGVAAALTEPDVLDGLSGKIRLCAVPAEELLEIDYRLGLIKEGKIKYLGGKPEFLARGLFDGVDMAMMIHTTGTPFNFIDGGSVGCIAKKIIYTGTPSHAAAPWNGHNALYAATCGLNAVNAVRETFYNQDLIRVHPIVTHGGDMVNAIPANVMLESYVRGASFKAIAKANKQVNRAFTGAALSLDTNVEIIDVPGYAPFVNDDNMWKICVQAAKEILPDVEMKEIREMSSGSTDMGDLSRIMPTVQPYACGAKGTFHGNDFYITDPERAAVDAAKWQLGMAKLLLENGAARAKQVIAEFKPEFPSKQAYLDYMDSLNTSGKRISALDENTLAVKI